MVVGVESCGMKEGVEVVFGDEFGKLMVVI